MIPITGPLVALVRVCDDTMHWTFEAEDARLAVSARRAFIRFLRSVPAVGDVAMAELVFGELVSNVVRHAPGPIAIECDWSAGVPVLRVFDRGSGLPAAPAKPSDLHAESGRGLHLVNLAAGQVTVSRRADGGTEISVALPLERATSASAGASPRRAPAVEQPGDLAAEG